MSMVLNSVYPDLSTMLPPAGVTECYVQGYFTPGDGGGGHFYWGIPPAGAVTDQGLVVGVSSYTGSERWIRIYSGDLNVKWFGLKGDGTPDNPRILNAIAASKGKTLYFPAGNYAAGSTVQVLELPEGCRLVGESRENTLLKGFSLHITGTFSSGVVTSFKEDVSIANLHIQPDAYGVYAIFCNGATKVTVRDSSMSVCYDGINFQASRGGLMIENTQVWDAARIAFTVDGGSFDVSMQNCMATNCKQAFHIEASGSVMLLNVKSIDCGNQALPATTSEQPDYAGPLVISNSQDITIDKMEVYGELNVGVAASYMKTKGSKNINIRNSKNLGTIYIGPVAVSDVPFVENITLENNENIGLSTGDESSFAGYIIVKGCNKMFETNGTYTVSIKKDSNGKASVLESQAYENDADKAVDTINYTTYSYPLPALECATNKALQSVTIEDSVFNRVVVDANTDYADPLSEGKPGSVGYIRNVKFFLGAFWTFGFESVTIKNVTQKILNSGNDYFYRGLRLATSNTKYVDIDCLLTDAGSAPGYAAVLIAGSDKFNYAKVINSPSTANNPVVCVNYSNQTVPINWYALGIRNQDSVIVADSTPSLGNAWAKGDKIYNTLNLTQDCLGWVCTQAAVGSTPPVWTSFGVV